MPISAGRNLNREQKDELAKGTQIATLLQNWRREKDSKILVAARGAWVIIGFRNPEHAGQYLPITSDWRPFVAQVFSVDVLADFAHQMRQPLSALEALTSYLDLISPEDTRIREQLRRMHQEIEHADLILCDGLRAVRAYLRSPGSTMLTELAPAAPEAVEGEFSRPLMRAATASVTH
jgi:hypothetical protein